jgi:hypothetical protein
MADFPDKPVDMPCPNPDCKRIVKETVRWRRDNPGAPCANCGTPLYIMIEGDIPILKTEDPNQVK